MGNFLQIFTFEKLAIQLNGQAIEALPTRKVEALLVYLAYTAKAQSREHLADILWDERSHKQSLSNLRTTLTRLNQQVSEFLLVTRQDVSIHPDADVWLDAHEFLQGSQKLKLYESIRSYQTAEELERLIALYRGDFLEGFYLRDSQGFEDWLGEQRQDLAKKLSINLSYLVNYYLESGDYAQGIKHAQTLLKLEPLNEMAYRQSMKLLVQAGQRSAALQEFEKCRKILREELATTPEEATRSLYESILAGQIPSSIRPRLDELPIQATNFIGREAELADINQHLASPECRLLTLLGLGGIGKTRLAYEYAETQLDKFANGVCILSLAEIDKPEQIIPKLAQALRLSFRSPKNHETQLLNYLRDKEMLIIMDNCDHLLNGMLLVSEILKAASGVKILATSREQLNLQGEWIISIEGLAYPQDSSETELANYPAIALFAQTAKRVQANYALEDSAAVIEICQILHGMPLALELTATWLRQMRPEQVKQQIRQNFELLNSNLRDIPERHRSIQLIFEESWKMLNDNEQAALMQLAVFQGVIDSEAAQAVGQISLAQLASLVEKSLIQYDQQGVYRLHTLLRRFILEKLEKSGLYDELAQRHAAHFFKLLSAVTQANTGESSLNQQISAYYDNYTAALQWAFQSRNSDLLAELIQGLASFWETSFRIAEGVYWTGCALDCINEHTSTAAQAKIFVYAGLFSRYAANFPQAQDYLEKGIEFARQASDSKRLLRGLNLLGHIQAIQGWYQEALATFEDTLILAQEADDEYWVGRCHNSIGSIAVDIEELEYAKYHFEKALLIYQKLNINTISTLYGNLGLLAYAQKNLELAESYFKESLAYARKKNELSNVISNLVNLGDVILECGNHKTASAYCFEAFEMACQTKNKLLQLASMESLGIIFAYQDAHEFAAILLGAVEMQRKILKVPTEAYNQERFSIAIAGLQKKLGTSRFEFCWNKGCAQDFNEIVAETLKVKL